MRIYSDCECDDICKNYTQCPNRRKAANVDSKPESEAAFQASKCTGETEFIRKEFETLKGAVLIHMNR